MKIKGIISEDFVNYKKPSMTIEFPFCSFKCDKECGQQVCHNSKLALAPSQDFAIDLIVQMYLNNDITKAIVFQGLEPFDSNTDLFQLIELFRQYTLDDIVIYTGYNEEELTDDLYVLKTLFKNIIIKFGRFIPNQSSHYDKILGVNLSSPNQYAKKIC